MRLPGVTIVVFGLCASAALCRADELRDPTRPYLYDIAPPVALQEKAKEEWQLNGIQIRGTSKSAILNGRLVREGERIGAATVVRIEPWQVTLAEDYRQIVIKLLAAKVKQKIGTADEHE